MKATRESNSKETVSNEKDWSLKQFLFLSSSLSSSLPQDLSLFFCLGHSYSVLFLAEADQQYIWKQILHTAAAARGTWFSTSQTECERKGCTNYEAALFIFLFSNIIMSESNI